MKEFLVYTGMRIVVFVGSLLLVVGVWSLFTDRVNGLIAVIVALAVSGVASYFLLRRQREAFARRVEERAARATAAFEERKAREDEE
ncbi:DUF4229 domain-containing protein [Nocardioides gansuensis]|uniref:DUF4229 domain-containing protein n=1 Tax=Nocardioides gansuensis TaxID=2138300 RepID=A0A2T8F9Y7_9ACTN|nr:DUF4229 domain-containing protein [Nocardioides gansuensis]PVG82509.1 DUF4229 domain-containing protein [Nocardioides gansuensis]